MKTSTVVSCLFLILFSQNAFSQALKMYVTLNPAGDFVAENKKVTGVAYENPDGSVEAKDVKVVVSAFDSGISLRDEHMVNKYLEAPKFPEILLKAAKGRDGKGEAIIVVKGKQAKVAGTYVKGKDKLKATFNTKVSSFGIGDISYKGIGVEDDVKIEVLLPLQKKGASAAAASNAVTAKASAKPVAKPAVKDKK